jgi:hypothetical protein
MLDRQKALSHQGNSRRGMTMRIKISATTVLRDIGDGMSDMALCRKYKLSEKGLSRLFQSLIESGRLREEDLRKRGEATPSAPGFEVPPAAVPEELWKKADRSVAANFHEAETDGYRSPSGRAQGVCGKKSRGHENSDRNVQAINGPSMYTRPPSEMVARRTMSREYGPPEPYSIASRLLNTWIPLLVSVCLVLLTFWVSSYFFLPFLLVASYFLNAMYYEVTGRELDSD